MMTVLIVDDDNNDIDDVRNCVGKSEAVLRSAVAFSLFALLNQSHLKSHLNFKTSF